MTFATRYIQCYRSLFLGGAYFTYNKLSKYETFSATYPKCNGDNHFKVINVITDTIRLPDIFHRISFIQFLVLIDGMNRFANITWEHSK